MMKILVQYQFSIVNLMQMHHQNVTLDMMQMKNPVLVAKTWMVGGIDSKIQWMTYYFDQMSQL